MRLLWEVCQIPDFRKTLTDAHLQPLDPVFENLALRGRLPTDWVADQIARLERIDGDIDALIARLARVRTWTYVAYRSDWLDLQPLAGAGARRRGQAERHAARAADPALHRPAHPGAAEKPAERRAAGGVEEDGAILVEGHAIGRIQGLRYKLEPGREDAERRALGAAARRPRPRDRPPCQGPIAAADDAFALDPQGRICGRRAGSRRRSGGCCQARRRSCRASSWRSRQPEQPGARGGARRVARCLDAHLATL